MRRRIVIELDTAGRGAERNIMDKIAYLAIKTIRSGGGNLVSIHAEEVEPIGINQGETGLFEVMRR